MQGLGQNVFTPIDGPQESALIRWRRGGGGRNPDFDHLSTTFLVLTAFNSVLPELVVLISTTISGRTELNAVSTRKVFKIGVSTPRPPRLIRWGSDFAPALANTK